MQQDGYYFRPNRVKEVVESFRYLAKPWHTSDDRGFVWVVFCHILNAHGPVFVEQACPGVIDAALCICHAQILFPQTRVCV